MLDWGLGHTTRSIPLISYLLQFQCQIFIAATSDQRKMLENDFSTLEYIQIEGYNVRYGDTGQDFIFTILRQLPRLYSAVRREGAWLDQQMAIHQFDLVISDNRYGLYHRHCASVFITHQLSVISGWGTIADRFLRMIHYSFIRRFNACWIPDMEGPSNLSGKLSHPPAIPGGATYIGPLSRMETLSPTDHLDLLVILSGPEPQRTILESILINQLENYSGNYLLVRGLPSAPPLSNPFIVNYLSATALNQAICNAVLVIARSGYSSIMDLVKLKKKAILIPTPGQTEQEYLAGYIEDQGLFMKAAQKDFRLDKAILKATTFPFKGSQTDFDLYRSVLSRFMQSLPH